MVIQNRIGNNTARIPRRYRVRGIRLTRDFQADVTAKSPDAGRSATAPTRGRSPLRPAAWTPRPCLRHASWSPARYWGLRQTRRSTTLPGLRMRDVRERRRELEVRRRRRTGRGSRPAFADVLGAPLSAPAVSRVSGSCPGDSGQSGPRVRSICPTLAPSGMFSPKTEAYVLAQGVPPSRSG
jgi:hypothetical protein